MAKSCPDCGSAVEYRSQSTEVLQGTCAECHHSFVVLPIAEPIENLGVVAAPAETSDGAATDAAEDDAQELPCPSCGSGLELESDGPDRLTATCPDCGTTLAFRRETADGEAEERRPSRPARSDEGRFGRADGPRKSPCRQCGAPLRFETNADQTVTGRCDSCGNEFTLPPRREGGFGGGRRFGGGDRRSGPPRRRWEGGGGGGYGRGPPNRYRSGGFNRDRSDRSSDDDDRPRRRRRE